MISCLNAQCTVMDHLKLTLSLSAALHMTDQVSNPCKATSKIILVYVSVITFFQLQMGRLLSRTYEMTLLTYIRLYTHTHTSSSVPKARRNPAHQTHMCDKQASEQTTGPDHDHRTVLLSFTMFGSSGLTCKNQEAVRNAIHSHRQPA
jgi:hypothetical protein